MIITYITDQQREKKVNRMIVVNLCARFLQKSTMCKVMRKKPIITLKSNSDVTSEPEHQRRPSLPLSRILDETELFPLTPASLQPSAKLT